MLNSRIHCSLWRTITVSVLFEFTWVIGWPLSCGDQHMLLIILIITWEYWSIVAYDSPIFHYTYGSFIFHIWWSYILLQRTFHLMLAREQWSNTTRHKNILDISRLHGSGWWGYSQSNKYSETGIIWETGTAITPC